MRLKELPYTPQSDYNLVVYALRLMIQLWPLWVAPALYTGAWRLWRDAFGTAGLLTWFAPLVCLFAVVMLVPVAISLKRLRLGSWNTVDAASIATLFALSYNLYQLWLSLNWGEGLWQLATVSQIPLTQFAVHAGFAALALWSMLRMSPGVWLRHMTESHENLPIIKGDVVVPDAKGVRDISPSELEALLNKRVIGQDVIAAQTSKSIARRMAQQRRGKPVFTGLFAGPTGTGKTELAKTVAEALFQSEDALFRVDCGNVMGEAGLQTLIGAPTGYMGSDKPGALTAHVTRFPHSVILFDEIEKAASMQPGATSQQSPLFRLLLSLLDEGRFTEQSTGRTVDASGCVILMTSNAAHEALSSLYKRYSADPTALTRATKDELQSVFSPEFLARIDLVTCFSPLDATARSKIIVKQVARLASQYDVSVASIDATLISKGLAQWQALEKYGAREVVRWIEDQCADAFIAAKKAGLQRVDLAVNGDTVTAAKAA